ncbi:unnamed protein product, partial [Meganyctiphanes norvegica]
EDDDTDIESDHDSGAEELMFTTEDVLAVLIEFNRSRCGVSDGAKMGSALRMVTQGIQADVAEGASEGAEEGDRWMRFVEELTVRRQRAWDATGHALQQYKDVLQGRAEEMGKVERLRQENSELRQLLQGVKMGQIENLETLAESI